MRALADEVLAGMSGLVGLPTDAALWRPTVFRRNRDRQLPLQAVEGMALIVCAGVMIAIRARMQIEAPRASAGDTG